MIDQRGVKFGVGDTVLVNGMICKVTAIEDGQRRLLGPSAHHIKPPTIELQPEKITLQFHPDQFNALTPIPQILVLAAKDEDDAPFSPPRGAA